MSWRLARGLGPLLLAAETQTRPLWLFLVVLQPQAKTDLAKLLVPSSPAIWKLPGYIGHAGRGQNPQSSWAWTGFDQLLSAARALGVVGRIEDAG
jgi:hypothetical protein